MKRYCTILLLLISITCWAQTDSLSNQLTIGINFMGHGETCAGGLPRSKEDKSSSDEGHSSFLLGRTRLNIDYSRKGLQAHAVIQNNAVWGMKGNQSLNLYESWVKMSARNGLFAQLGRVALSYDDERIIGTNDFATAALSHDVLRVGYEGHGHKVHAIFAYNQNGDNVYSGSYYDDGAQYYKTMQTVWYHYDVPKIPLGISLLFMNVGIQAGKNDPKAWDYETNPARTVYQQMFGGYVNYHSKNLMLEGAYYRQTGKQVNAVYKGATKIRAWMAGAKATIKPTEQYGFTLGYDHLSGDDYVPVIYGGSEGLPYQKVIGGFSPLYGSRTKFYGIMDYFYESAYINGFTPGLQNFFAGGYYTPNSKFDCSATYHYLAVATKLTKLDRTLGHSFEFQASYKFSKDISLTAGYTLMHGSETMSRLKQGNSSKVAHWGWFSLVISPSLFNFKW